MSWAIPSQPSILRTAGVAIVEPFELPSRLAQSEAAGMLPVLLESPGPGMRGRLALAIEEAIETALSRRGACPPGVGAATSLEASLADQLYRARLVELRGIAIGLSSLAGLASLSGVLEPDDSAVLRWWIDASERSPVLLVIERANASLGVYGPPRPLSELLQAAKPVLDREERSQLLAPELAASAQAMELSEVPPGVMEAAQAEAEDDAAREVEAREAEAEVHSPVVVERDGALAFEQPMEEDAETQRPPMARAERRLAETESVGDIAEAILKSLAETRGDGPCSAAAESPAKPFTAAEEPRQLPRARAPLPVPKPRVPVAQSLVQDSVVVPPLFPNAKEEWRTWAAELSAARGKKPLAAIERMFVASYVPLADAVLRGIADAESEALVARWATSFARSYEEAFEALKVRGKRPTMVLDVPEVALRVGRLHGARSVQLLLIDALRFDLGLRVEQRVRALVGQQAALAERLLLWSALPATTEVQLDLIGRGAEALAEPRRSDNFDVSVARGRPASTLRRVKTAHRELLKLDVVEARLSEPGPAEAERLDAIADETARILADYFSKQSPRTLVFAFGDHGFLLDRLDQGTRAARQGGSSPEEVLVPAFAWLVGGVH